MNIDNISTNNLFLFKMISIKFDRIFLIEKFTLKKPSIDSNLSIQQKSNSFIGEIPVIFTVVSSGIFCLDQTWKQSSTTIAGEVRERIFLKYYPSDDQLQFSSILPKFREVSHYFKAINLILLGFHTECECGIERQTSAWKRLISHTCRLRMFRPKKLLL